MTDAAFLRVQELVVATGQRVPDFELDTTLNLLWIGREASATTTMLTLAGRMKPAQGSVELRTQRGAILDSPRELGKHIALAGAPTIDGLDRNVRLRTYIREVSAWSQPWYKLTPRHSSKIDEWQKIAELFEFDVPEKAFVGELNPTHRFIFRIALALLARPHAELVVIDDLDQVRSLDIRAELIEHLRILAQSTPVIAASTNPDIDNQFDRVIALAEGK